MAVLSGLRTAVNILLTRRYPVSLIHFVTNKCNARCPHCFLDFESEPAEYDETSSISILEANPRNRGNELTIAEIDRLTRRLGPCLSNVNLTGGEPFLRKDLIEIAQLYFRNAGVRTIFISTHGGFTDRILSFAKQLSTEFPKRQLIFSISIDQLRERHDETRKIKGLFDNAIRSYHEVQDVGPNVLANIGLTISHTNYDHADHVYDCLIEEYGIRSMTVGAARDEGVYQLPSVSRDEILQSYFSLHQRLLDDMRTGRLSGFSRRSLTGRLLNAKNEILFRVLRRTLLKNEYISPCHAGAVFGIVGEQGDVFPCEILNRPLGNVRDYDYDFLALWRDKVARETKRWIRQTECHCDYACAWTFNILCNWRYQPKLLSAALNFLPKNRRDVGQAPSAMLSEQRQMPNDL